LEEEKGRKKQGGDLSSAEKAKKNISLAAGTCSIVSPSTYSFWALILLQLAERETKEEKKLEYYKEVIEKSEILNKLGKGTEKKKHWSKKFGFKNEIF
jgi:hypothetical protein